MSAPLDVPLYPERPDGLPSTERWLHGRRQVWTGTGWVQAVEPVPLPEPRTWPDGQRPAPWIPGAWPAGDEGAPDGAVRCAECAGGLEHLGRGLEHLERTGHAGVTFVGGSDRVWSVVS